jgi:hypothetical protein
MMLFRVREFKEAVSQDVPFSTIDVFEWSWPFNATDPRDKFYGLLGLLQGQRFVIRPDYESPSANLFAEMIAISILEENSFACLSWADPTFSSEDDGDHNRVP